jgi:hypothetical protein
MNQKIISILILLITIFGCTKQSIIVQDFTTEQIIHCSQMKNIENISGSVFYLNKGDIIPLKVTLDSEVVDIVNEEIDVILNQKVYFRIGIPEDIEAENNLKMSEENTKDVFKFIMIYLSLDAKSWVPYTDIKAVKTVFGIQGGSVSFGMGLTKEEGVRIFLNAKTTRK